MLHSTLRTDKGPMIITLESQLVPQSYRSGVSLVWKKKKRRKEKKRKEKKRKREKGKSRRWEVGRHDLEKNKKVGKVNNRKAFGGTRYRTSRCHRSKFNENMCSSLCCTSAIPIDNMIQALPQRRQSGRRPDIGMNKT